MTKYFVIKDSRAVDYVLYPKVPGLLYRVQDVDPSFVARYRAAVEEYSLVQEELAKLYKNP